MHRMVVKVVVLACLIGVTTLPIHAQQSSTQPNALPKAVDNEFHFVVLGDAQFHDPSGFNRIIDQTRQLQPAFVIQVGDLIEGYNDNIEDVHAEWRRFADQIAPLAPIPYLAIPGNHDLNAGGKKPTLEMENTFIDNWGALYYAFDYKNTLIIGLNTDSTEGVNRISGKQWSWLQTTLSSSGAQHKMVFMHRPPDFLSNSDALHKLFRNHGVSHVFYGHHHHYHHYERDGIAYSMTNAAANSAHDSAEVGSFDHLLQVSVRNADISVAVIEADSIKPQNAVHPSDNYDMFSIGRDMFEDEANLRHLGSVGENHQYAFSIPMQNPTQRKLQVFVQCDSEDNRWNFTPGSIEPVDIDAEATARLELKVSFSTQRKPESNPTCHFRVPLQTRRGVWVDFNKSVVGLLKER